jgi:hypothetical protein
MIGKEKKEEIKRERHSFEGFGLRSWSLFEWGVDVFFEIFLIEPKPRIRKF